MSDRLRDTRNPPVTEPLIPYTKAKAMKNRIDHRVKTVERAIEEMLATVTDHSIGADAPLNDLRAIAVQLKEVIDWRSERRRG